MKSIISSIQNQIREGIFINEASVIRGIINPILEKLGWPINDVRIVRPEYTVGNQRVDIALFHNNQPLIFIEAKKIGLADGAERQLFEYAFHSGVPVLILTDGSTWHFFLTAGIGSYEQRKVSKLDLLEYEDINQLCTKFYEYLDYKSVIAGQAQKTLEDEYKSLFREREIISTLPKAWSKLLDDQDELLFEIIANKVEELCNYQPSKSLVFNFLNELRGNINIITPQNDNIEKNTIIRTKPSASLGFTRIITAKFGDVIVGSRWANLISVGIETAVQNGYTISDIQRHTTINLIKGEEHERGFKFVSKANISYQGMDANKSWENALKLAQLVKKEIFVEFEWTNNPNAIYPGKRETLYWRP